MTTLKRVLSGHLCSGQALNAEIHSLKALITTITVWKWGYTSLKDVCRLCTTTACSAHTLSPSMLFPSFPVQVTPRDKCGGRMRIRSSPKNVVPHNNTVFKISQNWLKIHGYRNSPWIDISLVSVIHNWQEACSELDQGTANVQLFASVPCDGTAAWQYFIMVRLSHPI